eukprot:CAMPEP_0175135858 /NCGR_PEP_ID=MMETSP0087-20121206/8961_1 /TAXON_ID=136419 /ORGANISM="Unknown Unknown, Strain D1" /LENGTH=1356 /DNA_ID=CAMNT_0016418565 /DNA_START=258 /DNA_END=4328 /DNA_ORIENTATION=+
MANMYFLVIGIIQCIPAVSTTGGIPSQYYALSFVVFVAGWRAASEDKGKHIRDNQRNGYPYHVLQADGSFKLVPSGKLQVGNIIKILENEMLPADIIFIGSAFAKGHCFIDKSNLNGETTLEVASAINVTRPYCKDGGEGFLELEAMLEYEPPNKNFDFFRGKITVTSNTPYEGNIGSSDLLMRETILRNTEFIYGIIMYSGNDTKIQRSTLEGERPKLKKSAIFKLIDRLLIGMLSIQFLVCCVAGILSGNFTANNVDTWYLDMAGTDASVAGISAVFSWFILLSQLVPISLVVTSEMVKHIASTFIWWDGDLYYEKLNKRARINNSTIHEELGGIDYIFSDKTGTLTQNKMEFRYMLLEKSEFGSKETEIAKAVALRNSELQGKQQNPSWSPPPRSLWTTVEAPLRSKAPEWQRQDTCCDRHCASVWKNPRRKVPTVETDFVDEPNEFTDSQIYELRKAIWGPPDPNLSAEADQQKRQRVRRYMLHMALSNTIKPFEDEGELKYQAESAEELAMANFARSVGFTKLSLGPTSMSVQEYDEDIKPCELKELTFRHLATFGFTSRRARVTIIYQKGETIHVMTKGQDVVILPLLKEVRNEALLLGQLKDMSANGLRTLVACFADQPISWWCDVQPGETMSFKEQHEAVAQLDDTKDSDMKRHAFYEKVELACGLDYLGCIGLEDKLQDLVPETIRDCLRAGIKVWMITGDKLETARNIGLACNLIDSDMQPQFQPGGSVEDCIRAYSDSRLIEITGQWASLSNDEQELSAMFDLFDTDNSGGIDINEMKTVLKALQMPAGDRRLKQLFADQKEGEMQRESFIKLMQGSELSMKEAVAYDLQSGIDKFLAIDDHDLFPVSLLVNRSAFNVLFPPTDKTAGISKAEEEELEQLRDKFFTLASVSRSVVFARAEPAMKKKMVVEVQARDKGTTTLAIGDGANDTDMITAAHVGVGIAGVEGTAATNASDYAIGTFRMLHTLLFVHGFWNYHRIADMVLFLFYKSLMLAVCQFLFGFLSGFSGARVFNELIYQCFNVVFTSFPVLMVALLDKKLPRKILQNNTEAYREAKGTRFHTVKFVKTVLRGLVHALICFWVPYFVVGSDIGDSDGLVSGQAVFTTVVFICLVLLASLSIMLNMTTFTVIHLVFILGSIVSFFVFAALLGMSPNFNGTFYGVMPRIYASAQVWLCILLTVSIPLLMEVYVASLCRHNNPTFTEFLQEKKQRNQQASSIVSPYTPRGNENRSDVVHSVQDDHVWKNRKQRGSQPDKQARQFEEARRKLEQLQTATARHPSTDKMEPTPGEEYQASLQRVLLRFRNLTGSQFDSAAKAVYQEHDQLEEYKEEERDAVKGLLEMESNSK